MFYYLCQMNEFGWIVDIPSDHFTSASINELFEYAQVGDEVYIHARYQKEFIDHFGVIIEIHETTYGSYITVQFEESSFLGSNYVMDVPRMYQEIPQLWAQEQGLQGRFIVGPIEDDWRTWDEERMTITFPNTMSFLDKTMMGCDTMNFHLIKRD